MGKARRGQDFTEKGVLRTRTVQQQLEKLLHDHVFDAMQAGTEIPRVCVSTCYSIINSCQRLSLLDLCLALLPPLFGGLSLLYDGFRRFRLLRSPPDSESDSVSESDGVSDSVADSDSVSESDSVAEPDDDDDEEALEREPLELLLLASLVVDEDRSLPSLPSLSTSLLPLLSLEDRLLLRFFSSAFFDDGSSLGTS